MRLAFTEDPAFLNRVANHPDVRPWMGATDDAEIDLGALFHQPGAFALVNDHGGFVFNMTGDGGLQFHTMFLPEGRGKPAMEAAFEALGILFDTHFAPYLETYVPHGNVAAKWMVKFAGFSKTHEDKQQSYWRLTRNDWKARVAA